MRGSPVAVAVCLACGGGHSGNSESTAPPASNPAPKSLPERVRFQPLPSPFFVGQQYDIVVLLEDRSGQPASAPTVVTLGVEPNNLSSRLSGTLQATSAAGVAGFKVTFATTARHVILRATLASGVSGASDPFDAVPPPVLPKADGPWFPAGPGGAPVNVIAVAPDDSSVVFAATNRGLFRSRDGAASWTAVPAAGVENPAFTRFIAASASTLYAGSDGVYVSYDGGETFRAIEEGLPRSDNYAFISNLALHQTTGLWGWNAGLRRFDAQAQRWVAVSGGESVRSFWLAPSEASTLYATSDKGFLVSRDAGATWTLRTSLTSGWMIGSLAVNPADASVLLASKFPEGTIRSTDSGLTWATLTADQSYGVWFATKDRAYAVQYGLRFERSDDGGKTWTAIAMPGKGDCNLALDARNEDLVFAACGAYSTGTGVYKSTDRGTTWKHASEGMHAAVIKALSADRRSGTVFVGTDSGLYRTVDQGMTFDRVADGPWPKAP